MTTKKAVEKEALERDTVFEYEGDTYTIPPAKKWPLEVVEAQEKMRILEFVKNLLGEEQYVTLRSKVKTLGDLDDFVLTMYEEVNVDKGK